MKITLSWDLFILVFFALVITYSFIIGRKESAKIIVSSYIAIVAVQGLGNFSQRLLGVSGANEMLSVLGFGVDTNMTSILKLVLFITIIVFLALRAGVHIQYGQDGSILLNLVVTGLCGLATAGLLLSTLLTYIGGSPLLAMQVATTPALTKIIQQSLMMQVMMQNLDLWFTFPALMLIIAGFLNKK